MRQNNTFYDLCTNIRSELPRSLSVSIDLEQMRRVLFSQDVTREGLIKLLGNLSDDVIEQAAFRAHEITVRNFGRGIHLYTPLYLSNYCDNECVYCGFKKGNPVERKTLTLDELDREADHISSKGLRNVLLLTGGSRKEAPISYIRECVKLLVGRFSSISIEIYELEREEYEGLIKEGVDGLVLYQEVYDDKIYRQVHVSGSKRDYKYRLEAPERALSAGMRTVNIGSLLGLGDWRYESLLTALHAQYLENKFPAAEISVSVPRIRPQVSSFRPTWEVSDRDLIQLILAHRIFLPRVGITLSTRERGALRDVLLSLGVTRMSAGSSTRVGGHTVFCDDTSSEQFSILDLRDVDEIKKMLMKKGYQPILKDWT